MNKLAENYKVSVIIPIYDVSLYIEKCARSLMEQTLKDVEFIFVDDCTPDNSIEILNKVLNEYKHRLKDIRIIRHEHNSGLAQARRTGLLCASGNYIFHCDSDDWLELNMLEVLYNKAIKESADIVFCNFYISDGLTKTYRNNNFGINKDDNIKAILLAKKQGSFWSMLCKKNLYKSNIMPVKFNMLEDLPVVIQLINYSKKIACVEEALYNYRSTENSISKTKNDNVLIKQAIEMEANENILFDFFDNHGLTEKYKDEIVFRKLFTKRWMRGTIKNFQRCSIWCNIHKDINKKIFTSPYIDQKEKIISLLIIVRLYPFIRNIL